MKRKLLLIALSLAAFSGGVSYARAAEIAPGGCANTICAGVTYCNYSAGYSCSLTSDSCTNRFCTASAQDAVAAE